MAKAAGAAAILELDRPANPANRFAASDLTLPWRSDSFLRVAPKQRTHVHAPCQLRPPGRAFPAGSGAFDSLPAPGDRSRRPARLRDLKNPRANRASCPGL